MEPVFPFDLALPQAGQGRTQALHRQLRAAMLDGRLPPGAALPATRAAAAVLGVARNTVAAAYDLLVAEGLLHARPGAKAVVADLAPRRRAARAPAAREEPLCLPLPWRAPPPPFTPAPGLPARCFRLGIPEHRHFPHAEWRRLSAQALRAWSRESFLYAPTEGLPVLREAIAQHVAFARAVVCTPDDVLVTSGAQQAFDLLARALVTPGQTRVAVEEPGYPPLRGTFAAAGARLVPVPVDDEGLCVDRLPADVRVVSVTPSHQSPTGAALSLRRRAALLEFARTHGAVIVEDDYDGEFRFGGRHLDALQTLDRDGRVFYVGTFSKSLFPALRKGFIVAPAWAQAALAAVKDCADSHSDAITQAVLAAFIREGHLARHVRHMRPIYARRREALLEGIERHLAPWLAPIPCEAGLHLAARVRDPRQAQSLFDLARRHVPGAAPTPGYALKPATCPPALSFGYGAIDAEEIGPALQRFGRALARARL